jgi:hypothetical protein
MAQVIDSIGQASALLAAARAIAVLSVEWSPWPRKSREALAALKATGGRWSPGAPVELFDVRPERDKALNHWYEGLCAALSPRFELRARRARLWPALVDGRRRGAGVPHQAV